MGLTLIIAVSIALAVLAVDLVALWLLNLLTDVGMGGHTRLFWSVCYVACLCGWLGVWRTYVYYNRLEAGTHNSCVIKATVFWVLGFCRNGRCCVAYLMCILSFAVLLRLRSGLMYCVQTLDESIQEGSSCYPIYLSCSRLIEDCFVNEKYQLFT